MTYKSICVINEQYKSFRYSDLYIISEIEHVCGQYIIKCILKDNNIIKIVNKNYEKILRIWNTLLMEWDNYNIYNNVQYTNYKFNLEADIDE